MEPILIVGIFLALLFNFVNGLNDAANSIATVVATRVLNPLQAVLLAAAFNMIGPLVFTTVVAKTIGKGIVAPEFMTTEVILIGLFSAVLWVFLSSYAGIPISASHALVGGLVGSAVGFAGLAAILWPAMNTVLLLVFYTLIGAAIGGGVFALFAYLKDEEETFNFILLGVLCGISLTIPFITITRILPVSGILAILVFIVVSPVLGLIAAFLLGVLVMRLFRSKESKTMNFLFRKLQILSASFYSIGHGSNDAQNAMGVITAILVAGGLLSEFTVPLWVIIISSSAIALGGSSRPWPRRSPSFALTRVSAQRPVEAWCCPLSRPSGYRSPPPTPSADRSWESVQREVIRRCSGGLSGGSLPPGSSPYLSPLCLPTCYS
jgi:PiT family inorganic phosphate transporter